MTFSLDILFSLCDSLVFSILCAGFTNILCSGSEEAFQTSSDLFCLTGRAYRQLTTMEVITLAGNQTNLSFEFNSGFPLPLKWKTSGLGFPSCGLPNERRRQFLIPQIF